MTTSHSMNFFKGNKYPCTCSECKTELSDLAGDYPEGLPFPVKCDKCKFEYDNKETFRIFKKRSAKFISELPDIYRKYVKIEINNENFKKCGKWFNSREKWGIIFYGNTGTGKTTQALELLGKAYIFLGIEGEFIEAPRLAKRLRSDAMNGKNPEEQFNYFSRTKFLIIDDFLTEQDDHRDKGLIESLISEREKNFRKTILTTNATPEELTSEDNGYSMRMRSRLEKISRVAIKGKDFRSQ